MIFWHQILKMIGLSNFHISVLKNQSYSSHRARATIAMELEENKIKKTNTWFNSEIIF